MTPDGPDPRTPRSATDDERSAPAPRSRSGPDTSLPAADARRDDAEFADDRVTIASPEGLDITLVVVGIGSRFLALALDTAIQAAINLALVVGVTLLARDELGAWIFAIVVVLSFAVQSGYFIVAETLMRGRTPGKAAAGLRVVRLDGTPITFRDSAIRNIVRIVDSLPTFYLVGMAAVALSPDNQRLGDLAAGTLVVREPRHAPLPRTSAPIDPARASPARNWDRSAVGPEDVAAIRAFFARASGLDPEARPRIAAELRRAIGPRVGGVERTTLSDEDFLAALLAAEEVDPHDAP